LIIFVDLMDYLEPFFVWNYFRNYVYKFTYQNCIAIIG